MNLLTDEVRSLIGRETGWSAPTTIERGAVRRFAEAVGLDPTPYRETDDDTESNPVVPRTYIACVGFGDRGVEVPLPPHIIHGIMGSRDVEFLRDIRVGDRLRRKTRIVDIRERVGSTVGPMLMTTMETRFVNQHGEEVARVTNLGIRY